VRISPHSLIVSHGEDEHALAVVSKFDPRAIPFILDFREFGRSVVGALEPHSPSPLSLTLASGTELSFGELVSIWWRRPQTYSAKGTSNYVYEENLRFWESALSLIDGCNPLRWYNPIDAHRAADRKIFQLNVARQCGLRVPSTIVTSNRASAEQFINKCKTVVFKSFSGSEEFWQPTRRFDSSMIDAMSGLYLCPVIFQEFIPGPWDYRVTIIDDFVQAVRFNVGQSRYIYDVRIDTCAKAEKCELPADLVLNLLEFMRRLNLRYGAFDLRETAQGEHVFFEVNPAGQFLYLDIVSGTAITQAMADALGRGAGTDTIHGSTSGGDPSRFSYCEGDRTFAEGVTQRVTHLT
jgi:hypothetical protein